MQGKAETKFITIAGILLKDLQMHGDQRGSVTEILRINELDGRRIVQLNVSVAKPNVLRGVHVHNKQWDYIVVSAGKMFVALVDLRPGSPTKMQVNTLILDGEKLQALIIPPGIGHGFYSNDGDTYLNGMSEYWDEGSDQIRFHYNDPDANIPWPVKDPIVSDKDQHNPPLQDILDKIVAYS